MGYNVSYQELCKPCGTPLTVDMFPDTCPCCGANIEKESDGFNGPIYSCGGQYRMKPQFQNHTDKYWGSCPVNKMKVWGETSLLDANAVVWAVKENGERWLVASFDHAFIAEQFGRSFSNDYLMQNGESPVAYIEVLGNVGFGSDGIRYKHGKVIAQKGVPHHLKDAGHERQWFKITEENAGSYRMGALTA